MANNNSAKYAPANTTPAATQPVQYSTFPSLTIMIPPSNQLYEDWLGTQFGYLRFYSYQMNGLAVGESKVDCALAGCSLQSIVT
jgi:hypothetical protein